MNTPFYRCLQCQHTAPMPDQPGAVLLGQPEARLCIGAPPTAVIVQTPAGPSVLGVYPIVTAASLSCAKFSMDNLGVPQ